VVTPRCRGERAQQLLKVVDGDEDEAEQDIRERFRVSATTEEEVVDLNLRFKCPHCARTFDTRAGLGTHVRMWCGEARRETWDEKRAATTAAPAARSVQKSPV